MKGSIILMLLFSVSIVAFAQDSKKDRQDAKKQQKEAQLEQDKASTAMLMALVQERKFVLEANTLYDKTGTSFVLSPSVNFVGFDGDNSTIQLSFSQLMGWNGVGGVTLDGRINKMETTLNKNGTNFTIEASVNNKGGGTVTMLFRVSASGMARVDMNGSFGERLSFQGRIVSLEQTTVYKGTPMY